MIRLALALLLLSAPSASAAARRVAVVVGANSAAPGREPLRFAHNDADRVAEVLELAGFAGRDVQVLHDPGPEVLLAAVGRAVRTLQRSPGETLLLFYYSGHADGTTLYPDGEPLDIADLRDGLERGRVTVRVGIIDACRGGGWTGAKGLHEAAPFEVPMPLRLANEGSVLISSSSGLEDAHESEVLQGSYFTHHWNAALRGAGDRDGDATVTLSEAFDYARRLTIRDTARQVGQPQHPSFQLNLRGKDDLPLVALTAATGVLSIDRRLGPLQLIELESGIVLLEISPGPARARLAVPPGRYLVRRATARGALTAEVTVRSGTTIHLDEGQLTLHEAERLAGKGELPWLKATAVPPVEPTAPLERAAPRSARWVPTVIGAVGLELGSRGFTYQRPETANLRDYDVSTVPFGRLAVEVAPPGARRSHSYTGVALAATVGRGAQLDAGTRDGRKVGTSWTEYGVGVKGQLGWDGLRHIGLSLGLGATRYRFELGDDSGDLMDELPDVSYRFRRIGVEGRATLGARVALLGGLHRRQVDEVGRLATRFKDTRIRGYGLDLGLAIPVSPALELRTLASYARHTMTFTPKDAPDDASGAEFIADGATDAFFSLGFTALYRL